MSGAPFDSGFLDDLPYDPEVLLFDALLDLDRDQKMITCRMPTSETLPLTRSQRVDPVLHPRHVSGGLLVHATGMLGFVHAYFVLGLRHREGWVGYGTHIHQATFRKLVSPGAPIIATCKATKVRSGKSRHLVRYDFRFVHEGETCYEGDQTAMWMKVDASAASTPEAAQHADEPAPTDGSRAG
jgi:3-hydroxymyristoyl/3-hydroxydecanoyl-(acyl carrier protein) dehydratase